MAAELNSQSSCTVMLFRDDLHEELGTWPLAYILYGGAEFGEIMLATNPMNSR